MEEAQEMEDLKETVVKLVQDQMVVLEKDEEEVSPCASTDNDSDEAQSLQPKNMTACTIMGELAKAESTEHTAMW